MNSTASFLGRRAVLGAMATTIGNIACNRRARATATTNWDAICTQALNTPKNGGTLTLSGNVDGSTQSKALNFEDYKNLTIEGNGATINLDGLRQPFSFTRCQNVNLKNFSLNWRTPGFTQAEVRDVSSDGLRLRLRITGGDTALQLEKIINIFAFDAATRGPLANSKEVSGRQVVNFAMQKDGLDLTLPYPIGAQVGAVLLFKLSTGAAPAIRFDQCQDVDLQNVSIGMAPQMGVVAQRTRNFTAEKLRIAPIEGRLLSTAADGLHLVHCSGNVAIRNCDIESLGDDAVNIHDFFLVVESGIGTRRLELAPKSDFKIQHVDTGKFLPAIGDEIQLLDRNSLALLGRSVVTDVEARADRLFLDLRDEIPPSQEGRAALMCDVGASPNVEITSSRFARGRAHGLLLHGRVRIEGCSFSQFSGAGVAIFADANTWGEGCMPGNATISTSHFTGCALSTHGAIVVGVDSQGPQDLAATVSKVQNPIDITGNDFVDCRYPILRASGVSSLTMKQNHIQTEGRVDSPLAVFSGVETVSIDANSATAPSVIACGRSQTVQEGRNENIVITSSQSTKGH